MRMPAVERVARIGIVGAGTIGVSWAAFFLSKGFSVVVIDPALENITELMALVSRTWRTLPQDGCQAPPPFSRLEFLDAITADLAGVDFVQECIPEDVELKHKVLRELECVVESGVIIASSTSSLLCSDIQSGARHPERIIVGHPYNPPHLIPLVEVVAGGQTDPAVADWCMEFYERIGKVPIRVKKERIGHVANRLTAALYREAVYLVAEGIASVEDVDKAIVNGPGLRWAAMGPHLLYHLGAGAGGYRQYLQHLGPAQTNRWRDLGGVELSDGVVDKLVAGVLEETAGRSIEALTEERDQALIALLKAREGSPG